MFVLTKICQQQQQQQFVQVSLCPVCQRIFTKNLIIVLNMNIFLIEIIGNSLYVDGLFLDQFVLYLNTADAGYKNIVGSREECSYIQYVLITGVLITCVLITGVLITGVLITGVLITGVLITGVLITGVLITCVLITGVLITGVLITGVLITGVLITGVLITGVLITGVLITGVLITGVLITDIYCTLILRQQGFWSTNFNLVCMTFITLFIFLFNVTLAPKQSDSDVIAWSDQSHLHREPHHSELSIEENKVLASLARLDTQLETKQAFLRSMKPSKTTITHNYSGLKK